MIGDYVVPGKSDGMEEAEARLNMFKVPHRLPVGQERMYMHPYEYARRAAPALADAKAHERDVMDLIQNQTRNPIGGEQMARIAFNQREREYVTRDMNLNNWAQQQPRQQPQQISRDFDSRNVSNLFNDDAATQLVDGRGGGGGGYMKGQQLSDGHGVHQHMRGGGAPLGRDRGPGPKLIPSSAMLGADVRGSWTVDRDQKLDLASDPAVLERAAAMGAETSAVAEQNKKHSRRSVIKFGEHELNPGGHRLNEEAQRADDYGIARLRSDPKQPPSPGQVAQLLADPDPRAPVYSHHPPNKFAGRSQKSTLSFGVDGALDHQYRGPYAGRRAKSVVFEQQAGPSAPPVPPGHYLGIDDMGGPTVKNNPYAGKITESATMQHTINYDPVGQAAEVAQQHERRRAHMPSHARRIPVVEDVVFDSYPLTNNRQGYAHSEPTRYSQEPNGKRSVHGGQMPPEALRAALTQVGPRELGGAVSAQYPDDPQPQPGPRGGYADKHDLLHYDEFERGRLPAPPPPQLHSDVGEAINGSAVASDAYSVEPRGLPKRHPGPERLKRGRGIDGRGNDHLGRQLATSLVDEVIFGRQNFQGKINLANNGANFTIDAGGEFARR